MPLTAVHFLFNIPQHNIYTTLHNIFLKQTILQNLFYYFQNVVI